jgi:hypothetical protein
MSSMTFSYPLQRDRANDFAKLIDDTRMAVRTIAI